MGKLKEQVFECHWIKEPQERIDHDIQIVQLKGKCINSNDYGDCDY